MLYTAGRIESAWGMFMKRYLILLTLLFGSAATAYAESMVADVDGDIQPNEYRVISANGSTTRRPCPYTCEMREIPKESCKEWKSLEDSECYVQDLRIGGSDAMPNSKSPETKAKN